MQVDNFVNSIAKQAIRENVSDLMDQLVEKVDGEELLALLLSYVIDKEKLVPEEEEKFAPKKPTGRAFGNRRERNFKSDDRSERRKDRGDRGGKRGESRGGERYERRERGETRSGRPPRSDSRGERRSGKR